MRAPTTLSVMIGTLLVGVGAGPGATAAAPAHAYVGVTKCKLCHNSPDKGAQYARWAESPHAKAYATLASSEAKKIGAEKGIADPQKAPECLRCHVTGHGAAPDKLTDKYDVKDGVGCESCHGPGGDYWKMNVMKDRALSLAAGLALPDEKTCKQCHNPESPRYKPLDYKAASAKIAHPNPKKPAR